MIVATPVDATGQSAAAWGRAHWVAVAETNDEGGIGAWEVHEVAWDESHDAGTPGSHHARIARFIGTHGVQAIVVDHVGPGMVRMLDAMGVAILEAHPGDAQASVKAAVAR